MDRFQHLHDISISTSCRTCLENLNNTYHDIFASPDLLNKILVCTSLLVEPGDEFPTSLCEPCYAKINDFYDFKQICLAAAERYQEYINSDKKPCALELDIDPNSQKRFTVLNKYEEQDHRQYPQVIEHEPASKKDELDKIKDHQAKSGNDISKLHKNEGITVKMKTAKTTKTNFMCKICNKVFKNSTYLQKHMIAHNELKPYKCSYCEKSFKRVDEVYHHEKNHTKQKSHDCDICHTKFKHLSSLIRHKNKKLHPLELETRNHTKQILYECDICHRKLQRHSALIRHKKKLHLRPFKRHEAVDNKLLKADQLDLKSQKRFEVLNEYKEKNHDQYSEFGEYELPIIKSEHESTSTKEELEKRNDDQAILKYDDDCPNFTNTINEFIENEDTTAEIKTNLMCEICNKMFKNVNALQKHIRIHNGLNPYKCSFLKKSFKRQCNTKSQERIQNKRGSHECDICHRKFIILSSLEKHREVHLKALNVEKVLKSFTCQLCYKSYASPNQLKDHINEHQKSFRGTGSFQYSGFVDDLNKPDGDIVQYDTICNNSSKDTFKLNENEETTIEIKTVTFRKTNLRCEICRKCFNKAETLERHMRVHNGLKPFLCLYCGKSFRNPVHRKYHEMTHTGERPYKCNICHKKFTQPTALTRHFKKIHNKLK